MSLRPAKQNAVVNRETCYTASGKGEVESSRSRLLKTAAGVPMARRAGIPAGDEANHEQKHPDADPCERIRRLHSQTNCVRTSRTLAAAPTRGQPENQSRDEGQPFVCAA